MSEELSDSSATHQTCKN